MEEDPEVTPTMTIVEENENVEMNEADDWPAYDEINNIRSTNNEKRRGFIGRIFRRNRGPSDTTVDLQSILTSPLDLGDLKSSLLTRDADAQINMTSSLLEDADANLTTAAAVENETEVESTWASTWTSATSYLESWFPTTKEQDILVEAAEPESSNEILKEEELEMEVDFDLVEEEDAVLVEPPTNDVNAPESVLLVEEDVALPPLMTVEPSSSVKGRPIIFTAGLPVMVVVLIILVRAIWYYRQSKKAAITSDGAVPEPTNGKSRANGKHLNGHAKEEEKENPVVAKEAEQELQTTLEREATAKESLAQENKALQSALEAHKTSVEKFSSELQNRNERLSVFEKEQDAVRRELSDKIDVLKQELQQRQKQEQGNLKSKESLCNDLITKIKALNRDLENHEKLWKGVAEKAQKKEAESAAKVKSLKNTLQEEEEERLAALQSKEETQKELSAKLGALKSQSANETRKVEFCEERMGPQVFPAVEATLQARLKEEQEHSTSLSTKLQVFSAELQSREERVTTLDAKMKDVERLSAQELKVLQQELQEQVAQREKLQQAAVEMTRLLQEKQNQCVRLQKQWESSKAELVSLEERVQTLTAEVGKRETTAAERMKSLQAQLEEERQQKQACQETAEATNDELFKKQEEFVQLTTRMDLFLKELQFRDDQVASLESKLTAKEELATSEIKTLRAQLQVQTEKRDSWNKMTDDLSQLLKDKKAQVVGLTTRVDLFERELKNRAETVSTLEGKIKVRQEAEAVKMEPYKKQLHRLEEERDAWDEKTKEIGSLLQQKMAQTEGLTTRLKLFRAELTKRDERVAILRTTYEDKKQVASLEMVPVKEKLEKLREQRDSWTAKTTDIDRTLNEKRAESVGLKTRVDLFKRELEMKEKVVAELERKVAEKETDGGSLIASLFKKMVKQVKDRDEWRQSTAKVVQLLADRKKEAAELTAELKVLVGDLQNYQQRRAKLELKVKHQRDLFGERRAILEDELRVCEGNRDVWTEKVGVVKQALNEADRVIVGLETRAMLFEKELEQRGEALAVLEKEFRAMEKKSSLKIEQLRAAITAEKRLHEHGVESTVKLNRELKDTKRECVGLTTRAKLFAEELQGRSDLVSEQEKKIGEEEEEATSMLNALRGALTEKECERDDWKRKNEEAKRLQVLNDEEIVGLGTRLQLFMTQVMEREEKVVLAEEKLRRQRKGSPDPSLTEALDTAKENRDEWTAKALEVEQQLKHRKSQIGDLKERTRGSLVELGRCEEGVRDLKAELVGKERVCAAKIAPLKETLAGFQRQRDEWANKAAEVNELLQKKQEQCLPISARLGEVIDQLTQLQQRIESLEELLRDEETYYSKDVLGVKHRIKVQKDELSRWRESTRSVHGLLDEKQNYSAGLKTQLKVFDEELQKRVDSVEAVESKLKQNAGQLQKELDLIDAEIEVEHKERDRIIDTTLAKNQELRAMEDTCVAIAVRCKLFEDELRSREDQATILEARVQEKDYDHSSAMNALKLDLVTKRADRDKWKDSTMSMDARLKATERECVGLATRSQLFNLEKQKYEDQVSQLEIGIDRQQGDTADVIGPLHDKLQREQQDRDAWDEKTVALDGLLQENRREVVGLSTRSKLFALELTKKEDGVANLTAKIREGQEDFAERMEPLVREYDTAKADRDSWEQKTLEVKKILERTKAECASIPTRLDLFRREQKTRSDAVAELEASIRNKDDLVAVQFGFLLNELQLQQKQRGKWKKVTLEMHRLLKETKEQVAALTSKFQSSNSDMKRHQEQVTNLEAALRDTRDMASQQLSTLKKEVKHQRELRDKLVASTGELGRLLEEAKTQCQDLTEKLQVSGEQVQACTTAIETLKGRVSEKAQLDASQIESIKGQLKIHLEQRAEWRENTNQMRQKLKEKQQLCANLNTKLTLLKNLQSGEVRSSLSMDESDSSGPTGGATVGLSAHLERINSMTSSFGRRSSAEKKLTAQMETLEKELREQREDEKKLSDSTHEMERELEEKESTCADLAGQMTSISKQYSVTSSMDVDRLLEEKSKKQNSLSSKLESLAGALLSL